MLVNSSKENNHVEFVSYTGRYPNLCNGVLTLRIDGTEVKFGYDYKAKKQMDYPKFWISGGNCWFDDKWGSHVDEGEWQIDVDSLPDQYKKYAEEIDEVFNSSVSCGCCGGCI